jgi:IS5 family transposase
MSSTRKGNHYPFGKKAHIGVDAESGLVHTVEVTTAKVADGTMTEALLHSEERGVLGDRGLYPQGPQPGGESPGRRASLGVSVQTQEG